MKYAYWHKSWPIIFIAKKKEHIFATSEVIFSSHSSVSGKTCPNALFLDETKLVFELFSLVNPVKVMHLSVKSTSFIIRAC